MSVDMYCRGTLQFDDSATLEAVMKEVEEKYHDYVENEGGCFPPLDEIRVDGLTVAIDYECGAPAGNTHGGEAILFRLSKVAADGRVDLGWEDVEKRHWAWNSPTGRRYNWMQLVRWKSYDFLEDQRGKPDKDERLWLEQQYWMLDDWKQKAAFVFLVSESRDKCFTNVMREMLHVPGVATHNSRHHALATAIEHLDPGHDDYPDYLSDGELAKRIAREMLSAST